MDGPDFECDGTWRQRAWKRQQEAEAARRRRRSLAVDVLVCLGWLAYARYVIGEYGWWQASIAAGLGFLTGFLILRFGWRW